MDRHWLITPILLASLYNAAATEILTELQECQVLFVADLSETAPPTQTQTILSSMNNLFNSAGANNFNLSIAFWRYSRGGDYDGPIPTNFAYSMKDVLLNFAFSGGELNIEYATQELSNWSVQDVKIVLFTGSDPRYFPAAGRNYMRKSSTVGVAIGADTSDFAEISIPYMQPLTILDATFQLCHKTPATRIPISTPSTSPATTTPIKTSTTTTNATKSTAPTTTASTTVSTTSTTTPTMPTSTRPTTTPSTTTTTTPTLSPTTLKSTRPTTTKWTHPTIDSKPICNVLLWMDASSEAFKSIDAQVLQLQHIARLVYDYVPSPNFSFAGGIYVLGQDGLVQSNMNTFYYDFSSFNRRLTALRSQLDENHATGDTIKDTIELINKLNFWDDTMLIFFTASSSDEILQAPMNDKYEMTYAWDMHASPEGLSRVANLISSPFYDGMLASIRGFCSRFGAL